MNLIHVYQDFIVTVKQAAETFVNEEIELITNQTVTDALSS